MAAVVEPLLFGKTSVEENRTQRKKKVANDSTIAHGCSVAPPSPPPLVHRFSRFIPVGYGVIEKPAGKNLVNGFLSYGLLHWTFSTTSSCKF